MTPLNIPHNMILVITMSVVTILIRFLPFLVFSGKKTPKFITYLGSVLPYSIMAMLVVYCLKNVSVTEAPHGLPELIAVIVVAGLHAWKKNTLLSIVVGTICYMVLVQVVF